MVHQEEYSLIFQEMIGGFFPWMRTRCRKGWTLNQQEKGMGCLHFMFRESSLRKGSEKAGTDSTTKSYIAISRCMLASRMEMLKCVALQQIITTYVRQIYICHAAYSGTSMRTDSYVRNNIALRRCRRRLWYSTSEHAVSDMGTIKHTPLFAVGQGTFFAAFRTMS